jgi:hypothetical protein
MYVLKKEEIDFKKQLALAQLAIDQKQGTERFEEYKKEAFPWVQSAVKKADDYHREKLMQAIQEGPLAIKPVAAPKVDSRIARRVRTAEEGRKRVVPYGQFGRSK